MTSKSKVLKGSRPKGKDTSRYKTFKPRASFDPKPYYMKVMVQNKKKHFRSKPKGPIRLWVPKYETVFALDMLQGRSKEAFLVPRQWLPTSYDRIKAYVQNPNSKKEGGIAGFIGNQKRRIIGICTIANSYISINNVWLVEGLKHNILSISQFCNSGYEVMFNKNNCIIMNESDKYIVFKGRKKSNVYKINFSELGDKKVLYLLSMSDVK